MQINQIVCYGIKQAYIDNATVYNLFEKKLVYFKVANRDII